MVSRIISGAGLALLASVASAQNLPSADDITVTGRKDADRKAAQAYVGAIAVRSDTQLARFHQPVCTLVVGIPVPHSTTIAKRISDDAAAAGAPVSKNAKCSPNLIVMFADDGAGVVRDIRESRPSWLGGLTSGEIDRMTKPGPVRAWSVTSLRNEDGQGLSTPPDSPTKGALSDKPVLRVMTASILRQPTRQDVETSFVLMDKQATIGLTLRQIADYAAMRGLARTRPPAGDAAGLPTILTVLDPTTTARARELTNADAAYLRALYRGDGTAAAVNEKNGIARRIAKGK